MSLERRRPSIELGTALLDPSDTQGHRDIFEQRGAKERFVGVTTAKKIIAILSGFAPAKRLGGVTLAFLNAHPVSIYALRYPSKLRAMP